MPDDHRFDYTVEWDAEAQLYLAASIRFPDITSMATTPDEAADDLLNLIDEYLSEGHDTIDTDGSTDQEGQHV